MKVIVIAKNGNVWRSPKGIRVSSKPVEIELDSKAKAAVHIGLIQVLEEVKPVKKKASSDKPEKPTE